MEASGKLGLIPLCKNSKNANKFKAVDLSRTGGFLDSPSLSLM